MPEKLPYLVDAGMGQPLTAAAKVKVKARTRARSRVRRVINLILILLIVPLLGILATLGVLSIQGKLPSNSHTLPSSQPRLPNSSDTINPATTPGNTITLPTPTSFKSTSDTTMNISLKYPSGWIVGPVDQSRDPIEFPLTPPTEEFRMSISRFSTGLSAQIPEADQVNKDLIMEVSRLASSVTPVAPSNSKPMIGNDQWIEQDAIYTDRNNIKGHFTTITVLHNQQNYYNINFVVAESLYPEAMQKYIQPIFNSFRFLS